ncbi:hypothetical protein CEXT_285221 [Caerostris extrusa]|uniref:Secreted protein n=1 Tax=Caerostris extrusa TaxID=172846 RepID=A0AAV4V8V4_CAEEX|nr:hypothetical protein CEXT_285221 [Caerostris extrusa]
MMMMMISTPQGMLMLLLYLEFLVNTVRQCAVVIAAQKMPTTAGSRSSAAASALDTNHCKMVLPAAGSEGVEIPSHGLSSSLAARPAESRDVLSC